jgi:hypothetical protein
VFSEPAAGWSGTLMPSADLAPTGGTSSFHALAIGTGVAVADEVRSTLPPSSPAPLVGYVYAEPAGGWSGTIGPAATLLPPIGGTSLNASPAIAVSSSGTEVFLTGSVGDRAAVFVYLEPAAGWSGNVRPSAVLSSTYADAGLVVSGDYVYVGVGGFGEPAEPGVEIYHEPASGWTGTIEPVGDLYGSLDTLAVGGNTVVSLTSLPGAFALRPLPCPCRTEASVFTEPPGGWKGALATAANRGPTPPSSIAPVGDAVADDTAFLASDTSTLTIEQINATTQYAPPTTSHLSLSGIASGRPRLTLRVTQTQNAPTLRTITVTLPPGLSYRRQPALTITGTRNYRLRHSASSLVITLKHPTDRVSVTLPADALNASLSLRRRLTTTTHRKLSTLTIGITAANGTGASFDLNHAFLLR